MKNCRTGILVYVYKLVFCSFFLTLCSFNLFSQESPFQFHPSSFLETAHYVQSFGSVLEGSESELKLVEYLVTELRENGAQPVIHNFEDLDNSYSRSYIIDVPISGTKEEELLFIFPLNNSSDEKTSGFSVAMGLSLVKGFLEKERSLSVRVLFLGGDNSIGEKGSQSTDYYLKKILSTEVSAVFFCDFQQPPDLIHLGLGGNKLILPLWLFRLTESSFRSRGFPLDYRDTDLHIFRAGLSRNHSPVEPFLAADIPAVYLASREGPSLSSFREKRWVALYETLFSLASHNPGIYSSTWDSNYFILRLKQYSFILPEGLYITIIMILVGIFILVAMSQHRSIRLNIRREIRFSWTLVIFYFITFMFFFLATLFIEGLMELRDFPSQWEYSPMFFFLFKILVAVCFSFIFVHATGGLPISRSPHYYSYAALLLVLFDIIALAFINVSLCFYYIWVLFFVVIFIFFRKIPVKITALCLMVVLPVFSLYRGFSVPYLELSRILLFSRVKGNLILTAMILPFLFCISSINYWSFYYNRKRERIGAFVSIGLPAAGSIALFIFLLFFHHPFASEPQPLSFGQVVDINSQSTYLLFQSPTTLGTIYVEGEDRVLRLKSEERTLFSAYPYTENPLTINVSSEKFLNRNRIRLNLDLNAEPLFYNLTLSSPASISVYDSNYPFEMSNGGKTVRFFTGKRPPEELLLDFTLLKGEGLTLDADLECADLPGGFRVRPDGKFAVESVSRIQYKYLFED